MSEIVRLSALLAEASKRDGAAREIVKRVNAGDITWEEVHDSHPQAR